MKIRFQLLDAISIQQGTIVNLDFLDENSHVDRELGAINRIEAWWVERQEALERDGYMLRVFDRTFAWLGAFTKKLSGSMFTYCKTSSIGSLYLH